MLWILFGLSVVILVISAFCKEEILMAISCSMSIVSLIAVLFCLGAYNATNATADKQIAVLEQRNDEIIAQIEPLVKQYLEYELSTLKDLKLNADKVIAIAQYPDLKGNEFVQTQINIILENQEKITNLKLNKASLNAYKLWIFMGE